MQAREVLDALADLTGAYLTYAHLRSTVNFYWKDLRGEDFHGADLFNDSFQNSNLSHVDLSYANFEAASTTGTPVSTAKGPAPRCR